MSGGWIKVEKDLREDLRVKRMAKLLNDKHPALCNACAFQDGALLITVVIGALNQLWMHADTFARDDDTLDITADEIDQLAGIQGFAQILPVDWLEILDSDSVKLPGYQGHNGSEAKRKAQTAKRVSKHRASHGEKRTSVTQPSQPETHPRYQTRLDQTKTRLEKREEAPAQIDEPKIVPPAGLDRPTWTRWLAYRQKIKKPIKPPSTEAAQKALAAYGADQAAVVEQSIAQGWQGLFPLKRGNGAHSADEVPTRTWRPSPEDDEEIPHASR
jgi:hypothetical protein